MPVYCVSTADGANVFFRWESDALEYARKKSTFPSDSFTAFVWMWRMSFQPTIDEVIDALNGFKTKGVVIAAFVNGVRAIEPYIPYPLDRKTKGP